MSTRGLYGYIEGEKYTAQYNNSDSYPSGLGAEFFTACKNGDFSGYGINEDSIDFIKESLFCEWAYFYDKTNKIFEIWTGFQKTPDVENPFGDTPNSGYYPCKRIIRASIEDILEDIFSTPEYCDDGSTNVDYTILCNRINRKFQRDKKINSIIENDTNN